MAVSRASCKSTSSSIECVLRSSRDARGHEHRGLRYAVVLQSDYLAELSTWLVAPTSTSALPLSFRPRIEVEGQPMLLLLDQLAEADLSRLGRPAGRLTPAELTKADAALRIVLACAEGDIATRRGALTRATPAAELPFGGTHPIYVDREYLPRSPALVISTDVLLRHAIDELEVVIRLDVDDASAD